MNINCIVIVLSHLVVVMAYSDRTYVGTGTGPE